MLRADVPVGSYLSGGLDSSLVAALGLRAKGAKFNTFSLRFEDSEYDETSYQRQMAACLGSEHHEIVVTRADIAAAFPDVVRHAERPILRTAPVPLYLLSGLVRNNGIKVVLTGEGADEMFAGYDLFREAKVRRFWARRPTSAKRPLLLERLYPYLARSPVSQRKLSQQFFGQGLEHYRDPGFGHETRWRTTSALMRLFSPGLIDSIGQHDVRTALLSDLPEPFSRWSALAQDQYLEVRTLLSGYLLAAQGDRMLMAHSVEGRFPFLDRNVAALAESLPPSFKLHALDEKHVLKRAAVGLIPTEILAAQEAAVSSARCPLVCGARRGGLDRSGGLAGSDRRGRSIQPCGRPIARRQVPEPRRRSAVLELRQYGHRRSALDAVSLRPTRTQVTRLWPGRVDYERRSRRDSRRHEPPLTAA